MLVASVVVAATSPRACSNAHLAQDVRLGGVAGQGEPAFVGVARELGGVAIDDDEGQRLARQFARCAAADASGAAENVVVRQVG